MQMSLTDLQTMKRTLIMNKNTETNEQRINRLLAGDSISKGARKYITGLVEAFGIEGCAKLTFNNQIGLSVFEDEDGEQTLYYGDYGDGRESIDASYCNIEEILDAAEASDEIPDWWSDEGTVIEVDCKYSAYGSRLTTKMCA